jgi:uncharacterized membrane protein YhaH (DUF805 family)
VNVPSDHFPRAPHSRPAFKAAFSDRHEFTRLPPEDSALRVIRCALPEGTRFRTKSAAVPTNQITREEAPGEDAMKLQKILFSFDGRIGRLTYWLAILALIVAVLVLTIAPFLLPSEETAVLMLALTSQFIWLLSLWPILAVGSKRLHDRNKNGWWLLVFWLLPFALFSVGLSIALFNDPGTGRSGDLSTASILIFASLPPALWGIVELGILPGTRGSNLYGADPAQQPV